jgi:hypothetical protein
MFIKWLINLDENRKILKINRVSLFQITLYEDFWWHVSMCNKLNQTKFEDIFSQTSPSSFFILFHLKPLFHSI